jgi:hypothetical protein
MAKQKNLDAKTQNVEVGIIITHSDIVPGLYNPAIPDPNDVINRQASILKATVAGDVVYQNGNNGEPGWITLEAGEGWMIAFDRILTSATINGTLRSTTLTAAQIFWATTAADISPEK